MKYASLLFLLLLMACSQDKDKVKDILSAEGYTNISVGGYDSFACSEKDTYSNSFTAEKNGQIVKGTVCAGAFKNNTIRIATTHSKVVSPAVLQADSIIAARRQALIDSITNGTFTP
jgi:hypothetical protein